MWLNILDKPSYGHDYGGIITTMDNDVTVGTKFYYSNTPRKISFHFNTMDDTFFKVQSDNIALNCWHHFVVILDDTWNLIGLYQDASFVGNANGQQSTMDTVHQDLLVFGKYLQSSFDNFGKFVIDELVVFDRALSGVEVESIYQVGA